MGTALHSLVHGSPAQWDNFFRSFPFEKWFRGSSPIWVAGVEHAAIDTATYQEYEGRFVGMFRDPRQRGWSAYNAFVGEKWMRASFPAEAYARCIAGSQVKMVTGQMHAGAYGAVNCHLTDNRNGSLSCRRGCGATRPNMVLARQRLDEGFAFVGMTEEWAASICLFCDTFRFALHVGGELGGARVSLPTPSPVVKNHIPRHDPTQLWPIQTFLTPLSSGVARRLPCRRELFLNSRPMQGYNGTRIRARLFERTSPEEYRTDALFSTFADPDEMQFHRWVRHRFTTDLAHRNLTPTSCARDVCPDAADFF